MRKTACPVVWEGGGAQSPSLDPIQGTRPTNIRAYTAIPTFHIKNPTACRK